MASAAATTTTAAAVELVVQRYRRCRLLVDESVWVETDIPGLLVYVSFGVTATHQSTATAAATVLNLPIVTTGLWGDGSGTQSLRQMLMDHHQVGESQERDSNERRPPCSIAIVPQANLISKVQNQGKKIQYHGQIEKSKGAELYDLFCDAVRSEFYELSQKTKDPTYRSWKQKRDQLLAQPRDIRLPSSQVFRRDPTYGSFDDEGFPLTTMAGEELSKGVVKKLHKQYDSHEKRHQKWLSVEAPDTLNWEDIAPASSVISGSFGKRQGLEIQSDMGPFCHTVSIP